MEQKKKEKDVLIVRDEKTGEIGVVAGLKSDGTPKTTAAKPEHEQDFMKFDRHGDVLDNFFTNFFRQCKEPKRFGFYRVAADGVENVLEVLKDLLKNPVENKEMLAGHKVDTTKYEQAAAEQQAQAAEHTPEEDRQTEMEEQQSSVAKVEQGYKPIDDSHIDRTETAERWGVNMEELEKSGDLEKMRHYGKSELITCYPEIGGIRFPMQARLSYKENPDGTVALVPHPLRKEPNFDEYRNIKFTPEDQDNLKKTGNLGRVAEVIDPETGELKRSFVSIDRQTNETVSVPVTDIRIPKEVKGVKLSEEHQQALAEGKGVYMEGMTGRKGKFNATIQINADKRGLDFHFGGQKKERKQEQTQGQTAEGAETPKKRELRIHDNLLKRPVSEDEQRRLKAGETVYMEGLTDRKGQKFNAYVYPNYEKGKFDFLPANPNMSQAREIKPDNASRTQVAVNSEGKTNEATARIDKPLQQGQTAPVNEHQREQQRRPRMGM